MTAPSKRYQFQIVLPDDWMLWQVLKKEDNVSAWVRMAVMAYLTDVGALPEGLDRWTLQFRVGRGEDADYIQGFLGNLGPRRVSNAVRGCCYYYLGKLFSRIDPDVLADAVAARLVRKAPGLALAERDVEDELADRVRRLTGQFV